MCGRCDNFRSSGSCHRKPAGRGSGRRRRLWVWRGRSGDSAMAMRGTRSRRNGDTPLLIVRRRDAYVNMVVAYAVYLDGKQIGSIRNDSTERFKIETGSHDLRIRIQWLSSPTVEFQIGP